MNGPRDELERLRESRRRLVIAADAERRAIERELHDGVQQHLSALSMKLQLAREAASTDPAAAAALLEEALDDVKDAARQAALLAARIYPAGLEADGLPFALRAAAANAGIRVTLEIPRDASYPPAVAATLYWCCFEALQEAETEARVSVDDDTNAVTFGVVFDGSLGESALERLQDRVEALGGILAAGLGRLNGQFPH